MRVPDHPTLIRRMRDSRLARLADAAPFVAATLVETRVACGNQRCHCRKDGGHATRFLTFKRGGRTVPYR
jgi:hypothetical protein